MRPLKVSTEITVRIGPFVDKTDGVTEETGLAGAGTEISKAGGAFGTGPTLGTHDADGWYPITLTTTHTNTVGELVVKVHDATTHLPVWETFTVLPAVVYDSLIGGTDTLQVDTVQWLGTACATPTTAGVPEVDVTYAAGTAWGSGAITAASIAEDAGAEIADAVWDEVVTSGHTTTGSAGKELGTINTNVLGLQGSVDGLYSGVPCTGMSAGVITAAAIANGAIDAATFAADVDAEVATWIWNAAIASYGTSGSYGEVLETAGTEVTAIKGKTDNLPASPAAVGSAMTLANDSITSSAVADTGANEIADAVLNRNMATGSDSGSETTRTVRQALRFLRNKWGVSGTTLTVYKEDDSTPSWTATVTTDAAANPITANDPTST